MNKNKGLPSYTDHLAPKKPVLPESKVGKVNLVAKAQKDIGKAMRDKR